MWAGEASDGGVGGMSDDRAGGMSDDWVGGVSDDWADGVSDDWVGGMSDDRSDGAGIFSLSMTLSATSSPSSVTLLRTVYLLNVGMVTECVD